MISLEKITKVLASMSGISFINVLLIILKMNHTLEWSWWLIFSPIWITAFLLALDVMAEIAIHKLITKPKTQFFPTGDNIKAGDTFEMIHNNWKMDKDLISWMENDNHLYGDLGGTRLFCITPTDNGYELIFKYLEKKWSSDDLGELKNIASKQLNIFRPSYAKS